MYFILCLLCASFLASFGTVYFRRVAEDAAGKFDITPTGGRNGHYYACVASGIAQMLCSYLSFFAVFVLWLFYAAARCGEAAMQVIAFPRVAAFLKYVQVYLWYVLPNSEPLFREFHFLLPGEEPSRIKIVSNVRDLEG